MYYLCGILILYRPICFHFLYTLHFQYLILPSCFLYYLPLVNQGISFSLLFIDLMWYYVALLEKSEEHDSYPK